MAYAEDGKFCLLQTSGHHEAISPKPLPVPNGSLEENVRALLGTWEYRPDPVLTPGTYHPRIARGQYTPGPSVTPYYRDFRSTVTSLELLARDLDELFETIQPTPNNLAAYGHRMHRVLVLACSEVERALHGVAVANQLLPNGRGNIGTYYKLVEPMRLAEWEVEVEFGGDIVTASPFRAWDKKQPPTWWRAYNEAKHDHARQLEAATLRSACEAVLAAFVMGWAQFGASALQSRPKSIRPLREPEWQPWELYFAPAEGSELAPLPLAALSVTKGEAREIARRLAEDGGAASAHFQVWWALRNLALPDYYSTMDDVAYVDFFHASNSGHYKMFFVALAKLFDRDERATGFPRLRDALIAEGRSDLADRVAAELATIEPLVGKIKAVRNKSIAHNEAGVREKVYEAAGIKPNEIRQVIGVACRAINEVVPEFGLSPIDTNEHRFEKATLAMLEVLRLTCPPSSVHFQPNSPAS